MMSTCLNVQWVSGAFGNHIVDLPINKRIFFQGNVAEPDRFLCGSGAISSQQFWLRLGAFSHIHFWLLQICGIKTVTIFYLQSGKILRLNCKTSQEANSATDSLLMYQPKKKLPVPVLTMLGTYRCLYNKNTYLGILVGWSSADQVGPLWGCQCSCGAS
jgi:hypothetical protein